MRERAECPDTFPAGNLQRRKEIQLVYVVLGELL